MAIINIEHLKPGMVLKSDVKDRNGRLLLYADVELTGKHIAIFKTWGVIEVDIVGVSIEDVAPDITADPLLLQDVKTDLRKVFRHADIGYPAVKELFRLCTLRKARQLTENGNGSK